MDVDAFTLFGTGFFLFTVYLGLNENRRRERRDDQLERERYNRTLQERREFGYERVQKTIDNQPSFLKWFRSE